MAFYAVDSEIYNADEWLMCHKDCSASGSNSFAGSSKSCSNFSSDISGSVKHARPNYPCSTCSSVSRENTGVMLEGYCFSSVNQQNSSWAAPLAVTLPPRNNENAIGAREDLAMHVEADDKGGTTTVRGQRSGIIGRYVVFGGYVHILSVHSVLMGKTSPTQTHTHSRAYYHE